MSSVKENHYVISDLHLGHKNIVKYCRPQFSDIIDHDRTIIQNLQKLRSDDVVWVLGDVAFNSKALSSLREVSCTLQLICGNHDNLGYKEYAKYFKQIRGSAQFVYKEQSVLLTHIPIHPSETRWDFIVHGHTHQHNIDDKRFINVVCENTYFSPILLSTLLETAMVSGMQNGCVR